MKLTAEAKWDDTATGDGSNLMLVAVGSSRLGITNRIACVYRWAIGFNWVLDDGLQMTEPVSAPTLKAAKAAVEAALSDGGREAK